MSRIKTKKSLSFMFKKSSTSTTDEELKTPISAPVSPSKSNNVKLFRQNSSTSKKFLSRMSADSVHDLVQCPLCLEKFDNPKMFPCQHTFCCSCILTYASDKSVIKCPLCNTKITIASVDYIINLPTNLYINSLLHLISSSNSGSMNSLHENNTTSAKMKSEDLFAVVSNARCSSCKTLSDVVITSHCQHCKQYFCPVCWSQHLDDLRTQVGSILKQLDSASTRLTHKVEYFKDRCERLTEQIETTTNEKVKAIMLEKEELMKESEVIKKRGDIMALALKTSLDDARNTVIKTIDEKNDSLRSDTEKISLFINLHRNALQIINDISKWEGESFAFDKDTFRIETDLNTPSEAEADEPEPGAGRGSDDPLQCEDNLIVHYRTRNFIPHYVWRKTPRPGGIAMGPWNNNLYICGMDSHTVMIVERTNAKVIGKLSCDDMLCPIHIDFMKSTGLIFVTDKWRHCIHVFTKEGEFMRSIGSKGSKQGLFRSPEGIAIDNILNLIYVVDTGNDRIQILQPDGTYMGQLGVFTKELPESNNSTIWELTATKCTELNGPTDVAIFDNRIIVLDGGNNRVKIYNRNDRSKILEFGSLGSRKGQFRQPEVLNVDPLGFIIVGDSGNSRVQIFNPNGTLVRVFGGFGQQPGKFSWISGIHVTRELDIIVSDTKNHNVNFF